MGIDRSCLIVSFRPLLRFSELQSCRVGMASAHTSFMVVSFTNRIF